MLREIKSESQLGLFEALANTLPALVRICDATGASIWFNKEWLTFRGRSVEDEMGMGWFEGLHPLDDRQTKALLTERFAERKPYETKYRLRNHAGQYRWVTHRAAPRFNADDEFVGFITACIDIHDATVADHERSQFFNVASDILLTSNMDGRIEMVSAACERVLGWTAEEMTMTPVSVLIHPDDLPKTQATSEIVRRGDELIDFENRFRHKDGSYRWLSWRARIDEETGKIYGSAVDVTERKAFEAELQATIERHNLAISATTDGIWDWKITTDELRLSPRYIEMLGISDPASAPKSAAEWRSFVHPDDLVATSQANKAFIEGESPEYRVVFRVRRADGEWRTIMSRGVALRDANGVAYQMLGVHSDITEQRQTEDNLRQLKEMAEAANRAKSDFLANMSHEIRTPMNAVIGAVQLLGMGAPLTEKQQKLVGVLKDSASALMDLLNDFLDLSKIESGNLEFQQVEFDARSLVAEVIQLLDVQAHGKGLELQQVNDCACVNERLFVGDPSRIRQVLVNLCSNAVKFTERGRVSVEISCQPTAVHDVEELVFVVSDTGVGIPAEKLGAIFGKFEQVDSTMTRKFGGTGLGLAIVKALVEAMNGSISVESVLEKGSVFTVRLPLRRAPASEEAANDSQKAESPVGAKPKILLVEDLPANVLIAEHFLEQYGFQYEVANNGKEALDRIIAGENYDAILMDVQMPIMDGREATKRIRVFEQDSGLARNQIIAITAHAMSVDREKCLEAGMDDYISKPFDAEQLEQKLVRAVALRRKGEDRFLSEVTSPTDSEIHDQDVAANAAN